jgi:hypothetical protein
MFGLADAPPIFHNPAHQTSIAGRVPLYREMQSPRTGFIPELTRAEVPRRRGRILIIAGRTGAINAEHNQRVCPVSGPLNLQLNKSEDSRSRRIHTRSRSSVQHPRPQSRRYCPCRKKSPMWRCVINRAQPEPVRARDNAAITSFELSMATSATLQPDNAAGKQRPPSYGHLTSNMTWQSSDHHHARDEMKWTEVS